MQLASGDVPVKYETLPGGFAGTDATVARMIAAALGRYGARSPRIRALAINIIRAAKVPEKNYEAEAVALGKWVRDNIRYVKDVYGQETLSYPEELAYNTKAGDCLAEGTLLLTPFGIVPIREIEVGDTIWGKNGWTKVVQKWDKGILPAKTYVLNNGGSFTATDDHLCILSTDQEVRATDLEEGSSLLSPERISFNGDGKLLPPDCYLIGLFISDGWKDGKKICISGKDGHPKEEQKHWVKQYCQIRGWRYHWHSRYITIYPDGYIGDILYGLESKAKTKQISSEIWRDLTEESAAELLRGIMADSYDPENIYTTHTFQQSARDDKKRRGGLCFGSISDILALQVRLLFKAKGITVCDTLVVNHGGLGENPIHRVYPRMHRKKPVLVDSIENAGRVQVFDIETEDHGIYLPEADAVVHNCDDKSTLLAALLGSVGIASRFKVIGTTPMQYSHVYLQANPRGNRWITMDTIMADKPIGWEVPSRHRVIEKTYPVNRPGGVDGMEGLGYVGDPRIESHLEAPFIPLDAGTGETPARVAGRPAYVQMPSGLDTDAAIDPLMAFPPNQNIPQQYPRQRAVSTAPVQKRLTNRGVRRQASLERPAALDGDWDVMGPDVLAGIPARRPPNNMGVPPYMQTKTVRQAPEGVDALFARASLVADPRKGDKIDYYGYFDGQEKPPIRAYQNVAGFDQTLPGMGYLARDGMAGPGLGQDATGATAETPESTPVSVSSGPSPLAILGTLAAVAGGLYLLSRMR